MATENTSTAMIYIFHAPELENVTIIPPTLGQIWRGN